MDNQHLIQTQEGGFPKFGLKPKLQFKPKMPKMPKKPTLKKIKGSVGKGVQKARTASFTKAGKLKRQQRYATQNLKKQEAKSAKYEKSLEKSFGKNTAAKIAKQKYGQKIKNLTTKKNTAIKARTNAYDAKRNKIRTRKQRLEKKTSNRLEKRINSVKKSKKYKKAEKKEKKYNTKSIKNNLNEARKLRNTHGKTRATYEFDRSEALKKLKSKGFLKRKIIGSKNSRQARRDLRRIKKTIKKDERKIKKLEKREQTAKNINLVKKVKNEGINKLTGNNKARFNKLVESKKLMKKTLRKESRINASKKFKDAINRINTSGKGTDRMQEVRNQIRKAKTALRTGLRNSQTRKGRFASSIKNKITLKNTRRALKQKIQDRSNRSFNRQGKLRTDRTDMALKKVDIKKVMAKYPNLTPKQATNIAIIRKRQRDVIEQKYSEKIKKFKEQRNKYADEQISKIAETNSEIGDKFEAFKNLKIKGKTQELTPEEEKELSQLKTDLKRTFKKIKDDFQKTNEAKKSFGEDYKNTRKNAKEYMKTRTNDILNKRTNNIVKKILERQQKQQESAKNINPFGNEGLTLFNESQATALATAPATAPATALAATTTNAANAAPGANAVAATTPTTTPATAQNEKPFIGDVEV